MNKELKAIQTAEEAGKHDKAVELADAYVAANPDEFKDHAQQDLESCVRAIDVFRAAGHDTDQWRMQAWIYHHFAFQDIGGTYQPQLRVAP